MRATPWPPGEPGQKFRDDRIVWLAAYPELLRIGKPWWLAILAGGGTSHRMSSLNHDAKKEVAGARMRHLAIACEQATQRLTPEELRTVHATGELPDWFFPLVKELT